MAERRRTKFAMRAIQLGGPWAESLFGRAGALVGVSVLGILSALVSGNPALGVAVGFLLAGFVVALVVVIGAYRVWDETDQALQAATAHNNILSRQLDDALAPPKRTVSMSVRWLEFVTRVDDATVIQLVTTLRVAGQPSTFHGWALRLSSPELVGSHLPGASINPDSGTLPYLDQRAAERPVDNEATGHLHFIFPGKIDLPTDLGSSSLGMRLEVRDKDDHLWTNEIPWATLGPRKDWQITPPNRAQRRQKKKP